MQDDLHAPRQRARNAVLVVDDEAPIRELASMVLNQAGYRCLQAGNGQEALETFRHLHSEIWGVLTDVNMPILNGFGLVRSIRVIAPDMRIIFSSGSLGEAEKRIAADLRINAFIAKPWTAPQLVSCVQSVLESRAELVGVECDADAA